MKEIWSLYNKPSDKYYICINGKGVINFVDIPNFNTLAKGEKSIQIELKNIYFYSTLFDLSKEPMHNIFVTAK